MAENSKIEWCDHTANFWWGCFKVSAGCANCYADTLAKRYGKKIWGTPETTSREYKKAVWAEVRKWNESAKRDGVRRRVFTMSMGDFFENHPHVVEWRRDALHLMSQLTSLDWLVLTKRPENVKQMIEQGTGRHCDAWLADNKHVWVGTSVENQEQANGRIPHLLAIPAAVRFLSIEPLLGAVNLDLIDGALYDGGMPFEWQRLGGDGIGWVIVGGESGHGARPFNTQWAVSLKEQCEAAGVPFFFKQFGQNPVGVPVGYKITGKGGDWSEWPEHLRVRQFPQGEVQHG
jgi:protein gp37